MKIPTFLGNKVVKNAGWLIGGKAIQKLLAFFVGLLTARYLGPGNFGLINYATAYTTFFASLCTLGINSVIVKNFVDNPEETGETIGTSLVLRLCSSMFSVLMISGISLIVDNNEPVTRLVVLLSSFSVLFQIFDSLNYWFQYRLQSKYSAIAATIGYVIVSAYKVLLLMTGKSVEWFAISTSIDYVVIALFLWISYKKKGGPHLSISKKKAKELLTSSYHFILAGLMVSVYGSTDKLMLKQMLGESSVGYYATAVSVCNMWVFVLSAIIDSLHPVVMQAFKKNKSVYYQRNKQLYAIVFYVSISVSLMFTLFGNPIIRILYGAAYLPSVMPLKVITWYTAFSYLGVARNAWVVCEEKQTYLKYLYFGAAISNVVLNALFIPHWGATGAAAASLITQISTILIFPMMLKDLRPNVFLMLDAFLLKGVFPSNR